MQLIPVIDLKAGQVVRALRGERSRYRAIRSALCGSSDPLEVAVAMLAHTAADTLYLADLDALAGEPLQREVLRRLLDALPGVRLWLDGGFADADALEREHASLGPDASRVTAVIASEALGGLDAARRCLVGQGAARILSLDSRGDTRLDAAELIDHPALWPERVIAMTLERVGAYSGPDVRTIARLRALRPDVAFVGAGGIRDDDDLRRAAACGASAWLVASAVHDGRLAPR